MTWGRLSLPPNSSHGFPPPQPPAGGEQPRGKEHVGAAGWQGESSICAHTKRGSASIVCVRRDFKVQVTIRLIGTACTPRQPAERPSRRAQRPASRHSARVAVSGAVVMAAGVRDSKYAGPDSRCESLPNGCSATVRQTSTMPSPVSRYHQRLDSLSLAA